jgi:hypothetical protein
VDLAQALLPVAARVVRRATPFVFHPSRWSDTSALMDELVIDWNDLPRGSIVHLFLPGIAAEKIVSLRNLRHAPSTVRSEGQSVLRLDVTDVTYLPVPPVPGNRLAGMMTVELPAGVRAGQRYVVDVTHVRGGQRVRNGGFRMEILVSKARPILDRQADRVALLHDQLSLTPVTDRWRPVLSRRLQTERARGHGLADEAGDVWEDPTVWTDENGVEHAITGMKVRIVLERIHILDDRDPWLKGAGEIDITVLGVSDDNGGQRQQTRLPVAGHYELESGQSLVVDQVVFEGHVHDHLALEIAIMERDTFDPDDNLGTYKRVLCCPIESALGRYEPSGESVDPERIGYFEVTYRVERG